jgi:hypothetical protein
VVSRMQYVGAQSNVSWADSYSSPGSVRTTSTNGSPSGSAFRYRAAKLGNDLPPLIRTSRRGIVKLGGKESFWFVMVACPGVALRSLSRSASPQRIAIARVADS